MPYVAIAPRWIALLCVTTVVLLASLLSGAADLGARELLAVLAGGADNYTRSVFLDLRIPRTLAACGVGASLALAGVLLQALFRNPLADPYVLGVSGGAAIGALVAMALGLGFAALQTLGVLGAILAVGTVWLLGRGAGSVRLLLTGVVLASVCASVITVILSVSADTQLRGMIFWLAGDLSFANQPWQGLALASAATIAAVVLASPLNVLAAGELRAQSVGLDTRVWRMLVFLGCAILTTAAVLTAGTVGFVGLIVPHVARLLFRTSDHRVVAPAAAIAGATLVAAADIVARTLVAPQQLPVGAILALVGAPVFLVLIRRS